MATANGTAPATVVHADRGAPLGVLLAARVAGVPLAVRLDAAAAKGSEPRLELEGGVTLDGLPSLARYVARVAPPAAALYGPPGDAVAAVRVDAWLDYVGAHFRAGPALAAAAARLDDYCALRTYLVGDAPTVADYVAWGALQAIGQWGPLRKQCPHAARWHALVGATPGAAALADEHGLAFRSANEVAKAKAAATGLGGGTTGSFDVGLPGAARGAVVTRFPPEPSGYLHVGHAKAALLNDYYARHYGGTLILRFDDTNPSKESTEFTESIVTDLATLGVVADRTTYTSDYFPQMLDLAERLIRAGHLYADDTPVDRMREERLAGVESARRGRSVDENLAAWREMVAGTPAGAATAMRFKMDMASPNGTLRDPVAYRCNDTPHWRTGTQYKVYPTYDCACPFVDALEGVTHALRTSEYKDREEQYARVLALQASVWPGGLPTVHMWDYARLAFVHTVLSKRKLAWFVDNGVVSGWDDPRFPTVRGVLRRGLTVSALRAFILEQGASKNTTLQDWDKLWSTNRAAIDPVCPRHWAVPRAGRVRLTLAGAPDPPAVVDVPRHKKYPPAGTKQTMHCASVWLDAADAAAVAEGEEVTLMDWGNAVVDRVSRGADGAVVALAGRLHLAGSVKTTKLKLTWLPDHPDARLTPLTLVDFGPLMAVRKLDDGADFEAAVCRDSRFETPADGDPNMASQLAKGDILQLERVGYYIVDEPAGADGAPAVLFRIPDGKKGSALGPLAAKLMASEGGGGK